MRDKGFDTELIYLGKRLSHYGYDEGIFTSKHTKFINNKSMLYWHLRKFGNVLIDAWKDVLPLSSAIDKNDRVIIDYNSGGGFDHFNFPSALSCFRGKALHNAFDERSRVDGWNVLDRKVAYTGGLLYEGSNQVDITKILEKYKISQDDKVVIFFPKSIYLYYNKLKIWFPENYEIYQQWYLKTYKTIISTLQSIGCRVFVKLHPSAYSGYKTNKNIELMYWVDNFNGIEIPDSEDTMSLYKRCDFGVTILSHASIDLAYFGKPMIYVESENAHQADITKVYGSNSITDLPAGPSDSWCQGNWDKRRNPWIKSWIGSYCTKDSMSELILRYCDNANQYEYSQFNKEFWVCTDGRSSERIVAEIKKLKP